MRVRGMSWTAFWAVGLVVAIVTSQAMAAPVVVVPDGLADVEGNTSIRSRPADAPIREQQLYGSQMWPDTGPVTIYGYWLRPDGPRMTTPLSIAYTGVEISLSTTQAGPDLSQTYADNVGPDAKVVYTGDLNVSINPTNPGVGPNLFNIPVIFDTPFDFDPSQGKLLVDFTATGIEGSEVRYDAEWVFPSRNRIIWGDPAAEVAVNGNGQVYVRQFIIPEPSSLLLTAIGLLGLIGCSWRRRR